MIPAELERSLSRTVAERQAQWRAPGIAAGLLRGDALDWTLGVGAFDLGHPETAPDAYTAFGIGSITKSFTAVMVMQLRDAGALALSDPVSRWVDGAPDLPLRELLAHASGLQREVPGDAWDTMIVPTVEQALARLDLADRVLPPRLRWHYSNLAYVLLGEVVARIDGRSWFDSLTARLLTPLGLRRTSVEPPDERAIGYWVNPFADVVRREPWPPMNAFTAAGGLWSTVDDLARWACFLAGGQDGVLSADSLDEMSRPDIMVDLDSWSGAWGLGLQLWRSGERVLAGHSGGMPGFTTGLAVLRADRIGAVVLANAAVDAPALAVELACAAREADPPAPQAWRPGEPVPADIEPVLGRWWSESQAFEFSFRSGRLEARLEKLPASKPPAVFERVDADTYRTVSGREQGELLHVDRAGDGSVVSLHWAGYPFWREPREFGG